jgi:VanZ family protein
MENMFRTWIPLVIWSGVIFTLSSLPHLKVPSFGLGFEDKICHFAEFFIWGMIFSKSYKLNNASGKELTGFAIALIIGIIFATIDEGHQHWVPGRQFDFKDLAADWGGLVASLMIFLR